MDWTGVTTFFRFFTAENVLFRSMIDGNLTLRIYIVRVWLDYEIAWVEIMEFMVTILNSCTFKIQQLAKKSISKTLQSV